MYAINVNVYFAIKRTDQRGKRGERSDVIYGDIIMRFMFFGESKSVAVENYNANKSVMLKFSKKKYLYRAYWTQQGKEREL